ncbi:MAG: hypothetical protein ACFCD0_23315 [Gemmataceae bacterium]
MSTTLQPPQVPEEHLTTTDSGRQITIIGHSGLFYWWPVWLLAFVMGILTLTDGSRMALVPPGTRPLQDQRLEGFEGTRDVLAVPEGQRLPTASDTNEPLEPKIRMAVNPNYGGYFLLLLTLVILITNVSLRGVWSVVAILFILFLAVVLAYARWWDDVLRLFGLMHIYINASGYFLIGTCVLVLWIVTTFISDRLIYMGFSPGQFRVLREIGEGETAFDVLGMSIHKRRNDFFRHWILGLGAGDLVVRTGGAHPQTFELSNVLFVGYKLKILEQMLQEREVVEGQMGSKGTQT